MSKISDKFAKVLLFGFLLQLMPMVLFSGEFDESSDNRLVQSWVEQKHFLAFPTNIRLKLLEQLADEPCGERIFRVSMNSFNKFYSFGIKEIDTRMDLKRLLEGFRTGGLKFYVSDKLKIRGDLVFKNCTFKFFLEKLSEKYGLRIFYYQSKLYFVTHAADH